MEWEREAFRVGRSTGQSRLVRELRHNADAHLDHYRALHNSGFTVEVRSLLYSIQVPLLCWLDGIVSWNLKTIYLFRLRLFH